MSTSTDTTVRRLPVPDCQPPYDDEVPGRAGSGGGPTAGVQGTLALAFVLPSGVAAAPVAPPGLRLVPDLPAEAESRSDEAEFGPQPTGRAALPDPRGWAGRFVQGVVEVLAGDRPIAQLVRWTSTEVYEEVSALSAPHRGPGPLPARAVVRSIHVSEPADGVAEVAAMVRDGLRTTAVALRLEGLDGRWQCTALELG